MILRVSARVAAFYILASFFVHAEAQTLTKYSPAAKEAQGKKIPTEHLEPNLIEGQQRAAAISMITSLADESKSFKDQTLRVRVQARAADALWESDNEQARQIFRRAWDTAENIDKEGARATEEARRKFLTSSQGTTFIPPIPNLRSEVLRLAARRDRTLAETLLKQLEDQKDQETKDPGEVNSNQLRFFDPTDPTAAIAKRLELAIELIKGGEIDRAKMFADPALSRATSQGIIFLCMLRQKDAAAADERYSRLLDLTANDQLADATTISLLSSYVLTPNLLVTATRRGRVSNQWSDVSPAPEPPAELRARFLRLASKILLQPLPPSDQDHTSAGRAGTYFTIARLLPVFEQYAPDQLTLLNARLALLAPDTPEVYRNNENGMLTLGIVPEPLGRDGLSNILAQLSNSTNSIERDLIYVKAIRAAATSDDERIRKFADQIENTDLQKRARSFADFIVIRKALKEKDVERAVLIIRAGNVPVIHRIWAYAEAAHLLKRSDPTRAILLLNDATSEARSINDGESERVQALVCIASQFFELDRTRTWEITSDIVKASNALNYFTDEDGGKVAAQLRMRNVIAIESLDVPSFSLMGLFEMLAKDDFQRARSVANELKGEAPRANASLAIARSLLRKQEKD